MTWVVRHGGTELAVWCRMWRVRFPDGWLSEMVKITRAKDAAASTAPALLNRSGDARPSARMAFLVNVRPLIQSTLWLRSATNEILAPIPKDGFLQ